MSSSKKKSKTMPPIENRMHFKVDKQFETLARLRNIFIVIMMVYRYSVRLICTVCILYGNWQHITKHVASQTRRRDSSLLRCGSERQRCGG